MELQSLVDRWIGQLAEKDLELPRSGRDPVRVDPVRVWDAELKPELSPSPSRQEGMGGAGAGSSSSSASRGPNVQGVSDGEQNGSCRNGSLKSRVIEAARYSLLSGGKRIRPVLTLAVGELLAIPPESLKSYALAIELIHTASLVHDDLPALDNDDTRRGQPSCHKQFSEAIALLAGDFLISQAFSLISNDEQLPADARVRLIQILSKKTSDLCIGQGIEFSDEHSTLESTALRKLLDLSVLKKTAGLIAACTAGPALAMSSFERSALTSFGELLGVLFQITDDLLDAGGSEMLGLNKPKFPSLVDVLGVKEARELAKKTAHDAAACVSQIQGAQFLEALVDHVLNREH